MASLSDITTELADIQSMLQSDSYTNEVKAQLVRQIAVKITSLKEMHAPAARQLMTGIASMTIDADLRQVLESAINARLLAPSASKSSVDQQLLTSPLAYLTKTDWIKLEDPSSTPTVMSRVISERFRLLGIWSFDEQTYKWAIAIILHIVLHRSGSWPRYHTIFDWLLTFKKDYALLKTPYPHQRLTQFPPSPVLLPQAVFEHAYPGDDGPINKTLQGFAQLGDHIPLRKNSGLLVKERDADARTGNFQLALPSEAMQHQMPPAMQRSMMQMQLAQRQMMQFWQPGGTGQTPIPGMQYFGASARPSPSSDEMPSDLAQSAFGGVNAPSWRQHQAIEAPCPDQTIEASKQNEPADKGKPFVFKLGAPKLGLPEVAASPKGDQPMCDGHVTAETAEDAAFAALKSTKAGKTRVMKKPATAAAAGGGDEGGYDAMAGLDGHDCSDEASSEHESLPAAAAPKPVRVAKPALKRPSGAASVFSLKFSVPQVTKTILKKQSWHVFGSTVYHGSKNYALACGHDKADACEFARKKYKVAGEQWVAAGGSKTYKK